MVFWSLSSIPLVLYLHGVFARISRQGARVGTIFLLLGAVAIGLVDLFPDVRTRLGFFRVSWIHARVAVT